MDLRLNKVNWMLAASVWLVVASAFATAWQAGSPGTARITPLPEHAWTDAHRAAVATFAPQGAGNDLKTWLNHLPLVKGVMPFAVYITRDSLLSPRQRELLILRTAWLCRSQYLWARHAAAAATAGLSREEIRRVAEGPDARGWDAFEATLLRAADELHENSFIGDATWRELSGRFDTPRLIDSVFTIAELTMLAGSYNSMGVPIDSGMTDRLPLDVAYQVAVPPRQPPLAQARVSPLAPTDKAEWTPDIRAMLDPQGSGRTPIAIYRTIARNPKLYPPRQLQSEYIRLHATLPARERELLILRMGWLARSEYEWAQHVRQGRSAGLDTTRIAAGPSAPGWDPIDVALLHAADELYRDDLIADGTWKTLASRFTPPELMDILITAGGYRMVSEALNTFGVQLEPGNERFPQLP